MAFSDKQQTYIKQGGILTAKLRAMISDALGITKNEVETKRHTYIFSPPGAGKTFTTQKLAAEHGVPLVKIQGSSSMNAFIIQLATAVYALEQGHLKGKEILVWIDDCDSLFMEPEYLNVMKGALDQERNVAAWNKNLINVVNQYLKSENPNEQFIGEALRSFQKQGTVGIEVPTDRIRFLVTSNKSLTAPSAELRTPRKMHEAAIRDRVAYKDFTLDRHRQWGWVAHIALQAPMSGISTEHREELLRWMWDNWERLPATSMRSVNELAAMVVNFPTDYEDHWELYLL